MAYCGNAATSAMYFPSASKAERDRVIAEARRQKEKEADDSATYDTSTSQPPAYAEKKPHTFVGADCSNVLYPPQDRDRDPGTAVITVSIPTADLGPAAPDYTQNPISDPTTSTKPEQKQGKGIISWLSRHLNPASRDDYIAVMMTRAEYRQFWAKGKDGKYLEGVEEPVEGRRDWVEAKVEEFREVVERERGEMGLGGGKKGRTDPWRGVAAGLGGNYGGG